MPWITSSRHNNESNLARGSAPVCLQIEMPEHAGQQNGEFDIVGVVSVCLTAGLHLHKQSQVGPAAPTSCSLKLQ